MKNDDGNEASDCYPTEYINSLTPNGLPPHDLQLKKGAIVILIRNMDIRNGLCNGTRLKVMDVGKFVLTVRVITGISRGKIIMLPRIELQPSEGEVPFTFIRRQYPVRLGYAITINRGQGQSYNAVGVFLSIPVFSHGQLYVAASRCKFKKQLKFQISENATYTNEQLQKNRNNQEPYIWTKNIVYPEVLEW